MERTIDGIGYIAKSEVLRIIDEEIDDAHRVAESGGVSREGRNGWECRASALHSLRHRLAKQQGR